MGYRSDLDDELEADREDRLEERDEWFEVVEDEQIAEGDISVSETVSGHDPTPELDDEDAFEDFDRTIDEEDL
jgi:hypothetical protein